MDVTSEGALRHLRSVPFTNRSRPMDRMFVLTLVGFSLGLAGVVSGFVALFSGHALDAPTFLVVVGYAVADMALWIDGR